MISLIRALSVLAVLTVVTGCDDKQEAAKAKDEAPVTIATAPAQAAPAQTAPAQTASAQAIDLHPLDQVLGKADAPITIIEYASTTCPHCATFHISTLPEVKKNWIETGKAKLIYRDFPTGPAQLSIGVSMIAHCSGPERYFGVLGLIMENQDKWMRAENPLEVLKKMVRVAGMTSDDVDACFQRQDLASAIQDRAEAGHKQHAIQSTPSFLINGKLVEGALAYPEFDKALQAAAN